MDSNVKMILERAKATATYAAEKAGKMADAATRKAGDMAQMTMLNLQIFDLNTDIDGVYKEIGKIVYMVHAGVDMNDGELDDLFAQVDEKLATVAEIKETIAAGKTVSVCPECGKECGKSDLFCSRCGHKLN